VRTTRARACRAPRRRHPYTMGGPARNSHAEAAAPSRYVAAASGRKRAAARTPRRTKRASTASCATRNGASDWVGASGCRKASFWNACTTPTNTLR
jgi:hypothetical protein